MMTELENHRLTLQKELDAKKEQMERNRMGQFATPTVLAVDILRYAKEELGQGDKIRFIDPAVGTGSFYSALLTVLPKTRIGAAVGYEIDLHYGAPADKLWSGIGLNIYLEDFTRAKPPPDPEKYDLLICNPPYVRHHHIVNSEKQRLKTYTYESSGMELADWPDCIAILLVYAIHGWQKEAWRDGWYRANLWM